MTARIAVAPYMPTHPIVTIRWAGGVLVQGESVEPLDPRGFVPADMHGRVAVRVGGETFCGWPVNRQVRP